MKNIAYASTMMKLTFLRIREIHICLRRKIRLKSSLCEKIKTVVVSRLFAAVGLSVTIYIKQCQKFENKIT